MKIEKIIGISFFIAVISLHGIQLVISINPPSSLTQEGNVYDVWVKDDIAYFADYDHGLVIMDVSNPSEPFELGRLDEGNGWQIFVHSNLAYLIGNSKLKIIDVTNPSSPNKINEFDVSGSAISGMYVDFPLFYLEGGYGNFWIYNLSNPLSPSQLGYIDLNNTIGNIYVSNKIAYLSTYGLKTIDVSNSSNPTLLAQFGDDDYYGLVVEGNITYATAWPYNSDSVIDIIDVSDPSNPTRLSQFVEGGSGIYTGGIDYLDDTLYVFDHTNGLELIDVSDPLKPFKYAQFHMSENFYDIYIDFPNAYLICEDGFLILDISNPSNWTDISTILNFVITIVSIGVIVSFILLKLRIQKKKV